MNKRLLRGRPSLLEPCMLDTLIMLRNYIPSTFSSIGMPALSPGSILLLYELLTGIST
jgi:hypothetical protein